MARRQLHPHQDRSRGQRATAAMLACCLGLMAVPASAATPHKILCTEADSPDLMVDVDELVPPVSEQVLVPADYVESDEMRKEVLEPLAKATIREVFREIADSQADVDEETVEDTTEESPKPRAMNTRLPGVSEDRADRFKRQMYRRDI